MILRAILGVAVFAAAAPAAAHIVFAEPEAKAGSYYAGFLRVGHGCGDTATTSIRVEIPESVLSARPQPKPGWKVTIERTALEQSRTSEGGQPIADRVSAIVWEGKLPPDQFDQFGLLMKLPNSGGPVYFPTVQICETGKNSWTNIPASPDAWHATENAAPMLNLKAGEHMSH